MEVDQRHTASGQGLVGAPLGSGTLREVRALSELHWAQAGGREQAYRTLCGELVQRVERTGEEEAQHMQVITPPLPPSPRSL